MEIFRKQNKSVKLGKNKEQKEFVKLKFNLNRFSNMASRKSVANICTDPKCQNGHLSNSQYSSESSLDTNDRELHCFSSSTETLSELSELPTHQQPVGNRGIGKSRAELYKSPAKNFQTKPNLLGTASATRLNVTQSSSGQEYFTASGTTPRAPPSKSKIMGDKRPSKVTFKETEEFNFSGPQSSGGGDAKESITGMSKWKYPRHDSFIVDLNNPTASAEADPGATPILKSFRRGGPSCQEPIEEEEENGAPIYANIQKREVNDDVDETDEKKSTTVFYPSKSPLRQYGKKPSDSPKKNPLFNINEKLLVTYALVIAVVVACIMYFILLGYLIENRNDIQELRAELAKLQCKVNVTPSSDIDP